MQSLDTEPCVDKTPDAPSDWCHSPWHRHWWHKMRMLDWRLKRVTLFGLRRSLAHVMFTPAWHGSDTRGQLRVSESPRLRPLPPALITSGSSRHQPRREATVTTLWERGCSDIIAGVRLFSFGWITTRWCKKLYWSLLSSFHTRVSCITYSCVFSLWKSQSIWYLFIELSWYAHGMFYELQSGSSSY